MEDIRELRVWGIANHSTPYDIYDEDEMSEQEIAEAMNEMRKVHTIANKHGIILVNGYEDSLQNVTAQQVIGFINDLRLEGDSIHTIYIDTRCNPEGEVIEVDTLDDPEKEIDEWIAEQGAQDD